MRRTGRNTMMMMMMMRMENLMKVMVMLVVTLALFLSREGGAVTVPASALSTSVARQKCPVLLPQPPSARTDRTIRKDGATRMEASPRIVGGDIANSELVKMMAGVLYNGRVCTGILISPSVVAVGSLCVGDDDGVADDVNVILGRPHLLDPPAENIYRVESIRKHPKHGDNNFYFNAYGIAYVVLDREVTGVSPIPIRLTEEVSEEKSVLRIVGFGNRMSQGGPDAQRAQRSLHQADTTIIPWQECVDMYSEVGLTLSDEVFCYSKKDSSNCRTCVGDGPLLQYDEDDNPVLVGFYAGASLPCDDERYPNVGMPTSAWKDFVPADVRQTSNVKCINEDGEPCRSRLPPLSIAVPAGVGGLVVIIALIIAILCCLRRDSKKRKKKEKMNQQEGGMNSNAAQAAGMEFGGAGVGASAHHKKTGINSEGQGSNDNFISVSSVPSSVPVSAPFLPPPPSSPPGQQVQGVQESTASQSGLPNASGQGVATPPSSSASAFPPYARPPPGYPGAWAPPSGGAGPEGSAETPPTPSPVVGYGPAHSHSPPPVTGPDNSAEGPLPPPPVASYALAHSYTLPPATPLPHAQAQPAVSTELPPHLPHPHSQQQLQQLPAEELPANEDYSMPMYAFQVYDPVQQHRSVQPYAPSDGGVDATAQSPRYPPRWGAGAGAGAG